MMGAAAIPYYNQQRHKNRRTDKNLSDESFMLLLELSMQEPTLQTCIKIVQSTCLAQGIEINIKQKKSTGDFQRFVDRHYLPFAEEAVRHFFTLGFVPWRLRKVPSGDAVPEVIPLGLFTWRIDSMPNNHAFFWDTYNDNKKDEKTMMMDSSQLAALRAFERQKAFFGSSNGSAGGKMPAEQKNKNSRAYYRQKRAMERISQSSRQVEMDENSTKLLRYRIDFVENCGIMEEEVEIYEYIQPNNNITRMSVLYGTVPSPLAHLLVDYRNIRQAQIRQSFADAYNTQAKFICSYAANKGSKYADDASERVQFPENSSLIGAWNPQQRSGLLNDNNLPQEQESNAFARDFLTQQIVDSKLTDHKPTVYTLPKNTTLEPQQKLESIVNVGQLQV